MQVTGIWHCRFIQRYYQIDQRDRVRQFGIADSSKDIIESTEVIELMRQCPCGPLYTPHVYNIINSVTVHRNNISYVHDIIMLYNLTVYI